MTITQRPASLNGAHGGSSNGLSAAPEGSAPELILDDDELRRQLEALARDNQQLLADLGGEPAGTGAEPVTEQNSLEAENRELRARVAALEQQLAGSAPKGDSWTEHQKEYETLLEEKSEVIRALHQKIQELREGGASGHGGAGAEVPQQSELEVLKSQLEEEREQLRQDEAAVMQQMTQMEMTMSRERAEMARQRNELQRLHTDIRHELEVAGRDSVLRDRLAPFQRRHQEVSNRKGTAASAEAVPPAESESPPPLADTPAQKGILRRLFG